MISENLKDAGFILLRKESKKPLIAEGADWNDNIISYGDANAKLELGFNIGLVCGYNGIIAVDCDSPEMYKAVVDYMADTYEEETISGGKHLIFKAKWKIQEGDNVTLAKLGEFRIHRQYVVIAPSQAKDENKNILDVRQYKIIKDLPLIEITKQDILKIISNLGINNIKNSVSVKLSEDILKQINSDADLKKLFEGDISGFQSRSEAEQSLVGKLVSRGFDKEAIFRIMANSKTDKWNEKPLSYRNLTYDKAVAICTHEKQNWENGINQFKEKIYSPIHAKKFLSGKIEKEIPIIKNILQQESLTIIYGAPASCKSLLANYLAACISTGKKFLDNYSCKKMPVMILSTENGERTDIKRMRAIFRGLKIAYNRRKPENLQFFYLGRHGISVLNDENFYSQLCQTIEDNGIKLLIVDTISPLIMNRNDNLGNEIVDTFNNFLFPLIDKYKLSIILTMHSQKTEKSYLGSVKIQACADTFYELRRESDSQIALLCEKNREGEHNLRMNINFQMKNEVLDKIQFKFIEEFAGKKQKLKKQESKTAACHAFVLDLLEDNELKHGEIVTACISEGYTENIAKKAISFLYNEEKIHKHHGKDGGYYV